MKFIKQHWFTLIVLAIILFIAYNIYKAVKAGATAAASAQQFFSDPITVFLGWLKSLYTPAPAVAPVTTGTSADATTAAQIGADIGSATTILSNGYGSFF